MSQQIVEAYVKLRGLIKEQQKVLAALRAEEKIVVKEIQDYINQTNEPGIRIDEHTVIQLATNEKKISRNAKSYKNRLTEMAAGRGIRDPTFVEDIIQAKVENTVQQQKLKIVKLK